MVMVAATVASLFRERPFTAAEMLSRIRRPFCALLTIGPRGAAEV